MNTQTFKLQLSIANRVITTCVGDIGHRYSLRLKKGTADRQSQAVISKRARSPRKNYSMQFVVAHGFVPSIFACRAYRLTRHLAWHLHLLGQWAPPVPVVSVPLTERMYATQLLSRDGGQPRIYICLFHRGLPFHQSCFYLIAPSLILCPQLVRTGGRHDTTIPDIMLYHTTLRGTAQDLHSDVECCIMYSNV